MYIDNGSLYFYNQIQLFCKLLTTLLPYHVMDIAYSEIQVLSCILSRCSSKLYAVCLSKDLPCNLTSSQLCFIYTLSLTHTVVCYIINNIIFYMLGNSFHCLHEAGKEGSRCCLLTEKVSQIYLH